jgi:tetratricopeptide (TPR) repeat protein
MQGWKSLSVQVIILVVLVFLTYKGSLQNEFVDWDDYNYVVGNDLVRNSESTSTADVFKRPVSLNYHPLTILSLRLNNNTCRTCPDKISAAPFIRWNIILHVLNTLLVFVLIYLISGRNPFVSFFAAMIFGVHPMHVESVAWISGRKDLLYTFFFLAGLIAFERHLKREEEGRSSVSWLIACFVLFVMSCLSKAMAVVFPLVMILIDFWLVKTESDKPVMESVRKIFSLKKVMRLAPFLLVSLFFGVMAYRIQQGENFLGLFDTRYITTSAIGASGTFTLWQRIQFAGYGFTGYILKFFLPVNLSAIYPYPTLQEYNSGTFSILLKLAPAALLLTAALVIYSLRKTKLFAFGLGFYFITILMVLQFISVGTVLMADRYTYVSYIGLSFILANVVYRFFSQRKYILYLSLVLAAPPMIILASKQVAVWNNSETLWSRVIELHPDQERAWRGRGKYYAKMSGFVTDRQTRAEYDARAFNDFKRAIKLGTKEPDIFEGLGCIYGNRGDNLNAIDCFNRALELDSLRGSALFNRAIAFGNMNMPVMAVIDYTHALRLIPGKEKQIRSNRYLLYLTTGKFHEAVADLDYLLKTDPRNSIFFYNRGLAKEQYKDLSGAISDFQEALKLKPGDKEIINKLSQLKGNDRF